MLYDFFYMEMYFGTAESAQSLERLIQRYGTAAVLENIAEGNLTLRRHSCGEAGRALCWLSEQGRDFVKKSATPGILS